MARGWWYTTISLLSALVVSFSGMCSLSFLSFCRVFVLFCLAVILSLELCRRSPDFSCPADHVPDWQPRIPLGNEVEARSVNVKNTHTHTRTHTVKYETMTSLKKKKKAPPVVSEDYNEIRCALQQSA